MALPHVDIDLPLDSEDEAKKGALAILTTVKPGWSPSDIQFQFFTEGITNRILSAWEGDKDDRVLFRIFGHNTHLIIDREAEMAHTRVLVRAGLAPPIHATFGNGLVYGFVPGTVLDVNSVRKPAIARAIAKRMAEMHAIKPTAEEAIPTSKPFVVTKTTDFLHQLPESFPDLEMQQRFITFPSKTLLMAELGEWVTLMESLKSPLVFSHNDLLVKNIVWNEGKGRVEFIDYEYAGFNYQAFDIGDHFDEYAGVEETDFSLYPDEEYQRRWLADYAHFYQLAAGEKNPVDLDRLFLQVQVSAAVAHFFWGVWAIIQAANSTIDFDFLQYGLDRMEQYRLLKDRWFVRARRFAL